jgi:hypothetical protein
MLTACWAETHSRSSERAATFVSACQQSRCFARGPALGENCERRKQVRFEALGALPTVEVAERPSGAGLSISAVFAWFSW